MTNTTTIINIPLVGVHPSPKIISTTTIINIPLVGVHPSPQIISTTTIINMPAYCLMPLLCHQADQFSSGGSHIMGKGRGGRRKGVGSSRGKGSSNRWHWSRVFFHREGGSSSGGRTGHVGSSGRQRHTNAAIRRLNY